jgi:hypothetical protein
MLEMLLTGRCFWVTFGIMLQQITPSRLFYRGLVNALILSGLAWSAILLFLTVFLG